jgi:hypothetical protein
MRKGFGKVFYVYEHYEIGSTEPFYVGKGHGDRAYQKRSKRKNALWHEIVSLCGGFEVKFVAENMSEIDALWLETMCIACWGRRNIGEGNLINLTDGGEGASGAVRSIYTKRSISTKMKNNQNSTGSIRNKKIRLDRHMQMKGKNHPMYGKHSWNYGGVKFDWIVADSIGNKTIFKSCKQASTFIGKSVRTLYNMMKNNQSSNGYTLTKMRRI